MGKDITKQVNNLLDLGLTVEQIKEECDIHPYDIRVTDYESTVQNVRVHQAWTTWYEQKLTAIDRAGIEAPAEEMATDKQIHYAMRLLHGGRSVAGHPTDYDAIAQLTKRGASAYIDALLNAESAPETTAEETPAEETTATTEEKEHTMTTLRTDFLPDEPDTADWEPLIREAIATADTPRHAQADHPAITLQIDGCTYVDGTPIWDKPLVGSGGKVTATRADGKQVQILTEDGHDWADLAAQLDRLMEGWGGSVMESLSDLIDVDRQVVAMEKQLADLKAERAQAARAARAAGSTQYRLAQVLGRTESTVARWLK